MYELRKQEKNNENPKDIQIIDKGLFKSDRKTLIEKAKALQSENSEYFFWVFNNQKPKGEKE